jgi:hypothetical protein
MESDGEKGRRRAAIGHQREIHGVILMGRFIAEVGLAERRMLNMRFTKVWMSRPSGWKMIAWHSTAIP